MQCYEAVGLLQGFSRGRHERVFNNGFAIAELENCTRRTSQYDVHVLSWPGFISKVSIFKTPPQAVVLSNGHLKSADIFAGRANLVTKFGSDKPYNKLNRL